MWKYKGHHMLLLKLLFFFSSLRNVYPRLYSLLLQAGCGLSLQLLVQHRCEILHSYFLLQQLLKAPQEPQWQPWGCSFHSPAAALSTLLTAHFPLRKQHLLHLLLTWIAFLHLEGIWPRSVFIRAMTLYLLPNLEKYYIKNGDLKLSIFLHSWNSFHFAPIASCTNCTVIILLNYYLVYAWMSAIQIVNFLRHKDVCYSFCIHNMGSDN